jgi:uncharacterized membrane protein YphA (DoxX/SURF4 family)
VIVVVLLISQQSFLKRYSMSKQGIIRLMLLVSRILFGVVFIFSGFVKAIDPLGSTYKFQDYFLSFGMEAFFPLALPLAIIMSSLELVIGLAILFRVKMKYSAWGGLLFMIFFTPLTLYIAIFEPVSDCGCFGDALIISNWATFYKNIFILAAAIFIFIYRNQMKPLWSEKKDWYIIGVFVIFSVSLSVYCLRNLPIIDFRPWKIGNNIEEKMKPVQDEIVEFSFIYRNTATGETREFDINNLPSTDDGWEYVDRKETLIQEFIPAPIDNFVIEDEDGFDVTWDYLGNPDYHFILVAYDLHKTSHRAFRRRINAFAEAAEAEGRQFIVLTASSHADIDVFRHEVQAAYPFFQADGVKLKTIIRANPGLLLMKDWVVVDKWHHRNIPSYDKVREKHIGK